MKGKHVSSLSQRELEIARAYAGGASYRGIAERLFIAPSTVRTHLSTIYRKLGVSSKIQLLKALGEASDDDRPVVGANALQTGRKQPERHSGLRQVTVICAELAGPGRLASTMDAEDLLELYANLKTIAEGAAKQHGGQIAQSQSGQVFATFGFPLADETDAERAVQCALAIVSTAQARDSCLGSHATPRVGVYTGRTISGDGSDPSTLLGGGQVLSAALSREAAAGEIVVCANTRASLGQMFAFDELGEVQVSEDASSMARYLVRGAARPATRFDALYGYKLTPLVGRDAEISLLMDRFELGQSGMGQLVLLIGQAGIGKSRTVKTLADKVKGIVSDVSAYRTDLGV